MDTVRHLFTPEGHAALAAAMQRRCLLAFDFDGTLAPIVAHPDDARILPAVATRLDALARRWPVAIVSGRAVADVRARLGFEPHYIIGNHGAEDPADPGGAQRRSRELDGLRAALAPRRPALAAAGVLVEDKGASIALHYRLAAAPAAALALIRACLARAGQPLHVFEGKMVVNVGPAGAPDKAHAVRTLVARCGADSAVFAGDDLNDEPVFHAAPPQWLTIRIGRDGPPTHARFVLDDPHEVALLLECMLARGGGTGPTPQAPKPG